MAVGEYAVAGRSAAARVGAAKARARGGGVEVGRAVEEARVEGKQAEAAAA